MGTVDVNNYEQIARIMLAAAPRPHARLGGEFRVRGDMFSGEFFAPDFSRDTAVHSSRATKFSL